MNNTDENSFCPIDQTRKFVFSCGPHVGCFNECCRDLNQFLTPYDVLRLKNHLGIASYKFLEEYCLRHDGPRTGLPLVTLRPQAGPELKCPFISPEGCQVYENRPASCRMYPVARMAGRDRGTGEIREQFMLIRESHCMGFVKGPEMTVIQWMENQGLIPYNAANDSMIELIGVKQEFRPGPLPRILADRIFTSLYDLDNVKKHFYSDGTAAICRKTGQEVTDDLTDESLLTRMLDRVAMMLKDDTA